MPDLTIGVDLGGTKIAVALVDGRGEVLAEGRRPTGAERGVEAVVDEIAEAVRETGGGRLHNVAAVGVGAPGPLNCREGVIYKAPNLRGWDNVPFVRLLRERIGLPVVLENDANAAALGEWALGAGRGTRHMIYLTISTGIGGGIIIDGRIYHGRDDGAGEVGHMTVLPEGPPCGCGRRGCWESLCSGTGIAASMVRRLEAGASSAVLDMAGGDLKAVTSAQVAKAAAAGDRVAKEVFDEAVFYLGLGITNLIHLLNPEAVVIGGGVSHLGDQLFLPVRSVVRERAYQAMAHDLPIVPASLGDRSGVLGAAMVAKQ